MNRKIIFSLLHLMSTLLLVNAKDKLSFDGQWEIIFDNNNVGQEAVSQCKWIKEMARI